MFPSYSTGLSGLPWWKYTSFSLEINQNTPDLFRSKIGGEPPNFPFLLTHIFAASIFFQKRVKKNIIFCQNLGHSRPTQTRKTPGFGQISKQTRNIPWHQIEKSRKSAFKRNQICESWFKNTQPGSPALAESSDLNWFPAQEFRVTISKYWTPFNLFLFKKHINYNHCQNHKEVCA